MKFYSISLLLLGASAIKLDGPFYGATNQHKFSGKQEWEDNGENAARTKASISTALFDWYGNSLGEAQAKQVCQAVLFGSKQMTNDGYEKFGKTFAKAWAKEKKDPMSEKDLRLLCDSIGG